MERRERVAGRGREWWEEGEGEVDVDVKCCDFRRWARVVWREEIWEGRAEMWAVWEWVVRWPGKWG